VVVNVNALDMTEPLGDADAAEFVAGALEVTDGDAEMDEDAQALAVARSEAVAVFENVCKGEALKDKEANGVDEPVEDLELMCVPVIETVAVAVPDRENVSVGDADDDAEADVVVVGVADDLKEGDSAVRVPGLCARTVSRITYDIDTVRVLEAVPLAVFVPLPVTLVVRVAVDEGEVVVEPLDVGVDDAHAVCEPPGVDDAVLLDESVADCDEVVLAVDEGKIVAVGETDCESEGVALDVEVADTLRIAQGDGEEVIDTERLRVVVVVSDVDGDSELVGEEGVGRSMEADCECVGG